MYSGQYLLSTLSILVLSEGNWVYDWPYGAQGDCRCKKIGIQTGYADENACLEAFAGEPYEYCWTKTKSGELLGGITESDCANYAVSTHPTVSNMDCESKCLKVVVGSLSEGEFFHYCKLETIAKAGSTVSPAPSGCFVNYVLGHADFNPGKRNEETIPPLRVFEEVESAAKCQSLCQQLNDCAWFQWRAVGDDSCNTSWDISYQREPLTCELYGYNFVQAVMNLDVNSFDSEKNPGYVGGVCDLEQYEDQGCSDLFKTSTWSPVKPMKCLSCECEPRCAFTSYSHISGPAYCQSDIITDVCSIKPPFDHTTPAPECPTSQCEAPTTSPEETTSQPSATRPETQSVYTTMPEGTTGFTTQPEGSTTGLETTGTAPVTTAGGQETTTAPVTTAGQTQSGATTAMTTTAPSSESTTTGFETMTTTTGFETTEQSPDSTTGKAETTLPGRTTPPHGTEKPSCPCPEEDTDCECPCEDCIDANWEPEDLQK